MPERALLFLLLALGALLHAAAAALCIRFGFDFGWPYTILFGLPVMIRELVARRTNWWLIGYFLVLVPLFHSVATVAAMKAWAPDGGANALFVAGLAGGAVGAGLSLLVLLWPRVGAAGPVWFAAGFVLLSLLGGIGLQTGYSPFGLPDDRIVLFLYLPWQLVFALVLSRLLRLSPPRGAG